MKSDLLKWIEGGNCESCMGGHGNCGAWREELKTMTACQGDEYYANAKQIAEKIADAEAGNHPWVRGNTLFVCNVGKCRQADGCEWKKPGPFKKVICHVTLPDCKVLIPYRGSKSEKATWPGRTGEDCSEVESAPVWGEDGEMCSSCKFVPDVGTCDYFSDSTCSHENDMSMYERKKDRSDHKYNDNRQALKEAGEDVLKEEIVKMGAEYVVTSPIRLTSLASNVSIQPHVFLWFFRNYNATQGWEIPVGTDFDSNYFAFEHVEELIRMGFIEEKVEDPIVVED